MPIESDDDDDVLLEVVDALLESDSEDDEAGRQDKPYRQRQVSERPVYWESLWGKQLRSGEMGDKTTIPGKRFRRRFAGVPYSVFLDLVQLANEKMGFSKREWYKGRRVPPLELKVLCWLRIVGRGVGYDCAAEATLIGEETVRAFFHAFSAKGRAVLYPMYVKMPGNKAEIEAISDVYERVGFPGCVGSSDGVDLHWGCCPAMLVEAHKGKDGVPSRGFNVTIATFSFARVCA
jgi:hypothetical protein